MAANTLTNLIPDLYQAIDIVSRELTGAISAVRINASGEAAGLNQTIRIPVTPASTASDVTPGAYAPASGNQTIGNETITISSSRYVPIQWQGEEQRSYSHNGTYETTLGQQFEQAMRTLANEVETDICELYNNASRAYGTAGTTPFASSLSDAAYAKKILDDNGAPMTDRHMVINTTAGVNLRSLSNLNQANTAGTDATLRSGVLLPLFGLDVRESAQIQTHTHGTETGSTTDDTGYAIGSTSIALATAGTGTILTGDVVTFGTDTNKYVVLTGDTGVSDAGTIVLGKPGLVSAIAASATAINLSGDYTANMFFHRDAIQLVTRGPAMTEGGDEADDVMLITDPRTGIVFQIALYRQYRQVHYEVGLAWGVDVIKPEHMGLLLG
jgi:hypothetical protein